MYKKDSQAYNQRISAVLECMYRNREMSRIELSQAAHATPAIITELTNDMIQQGLIMETGDEVSRIAGSGRRRKLLCLNPDYACLLGIEINMRGIFTVVTNILGEVKIAGHVSLTDYNPSDINNEIVAQIHRCLKKLPGSSILGAGIAIPGHFDYGSRKIISNNTLWESFQLPEIEKHFSFPFIVDNNIESMSFGEYLFRPQSCPDKFLFYHIGPGIFCSYFNSEQLSIKKNCYIGEVGHTVVDINGPLCECGKKGCLQTYISESWLIKNGQYLLTHSSSSILSGLVHSPDEIDIETIIKAYTLGDPYFSPQIDLGIRLLSVSIANTLIMQDCEKIYLNSKLFHHAPFKNQIVSLINEQLNFIPVEHKIEIEIVPYDDFRGAQGACALAAFAFFIKNKNFQTQ